MPVRCESSVRVMSVRCESSVRVMSEWCESSVARAVRERRKSGVRAAAADI